MPASLNLTPVATGTLALDPISPPGSINSTYGQAVYGVNPYGSLGAQTLSLVPIVLGSLGLTKQSASSLSLASSPSGSLPLTPIT